MLSPSLRQEVTVAAITAALLCDFAQVRDNLLFVASGGITRAYRDSVPAPLGLMAALMVEIEYAEFDRVHEVTLAIKHVASATEAARATSGVRAAGNVDAGESIYLPLVFDVRGVVVPSYGAYDVQVAVDGGIGTQLTFSVVTPPPKLT